MTTQMDIVDTAVLDGFRAIMYEKVLDPSLNIRKTRITVADDAARNLVVDFESTLMPDVLRAKLWRVITDHFRNGEGR